MQILAQKELIGAAMDNSDGLLPTLAELSSKNGLGILLDLERLRVPGVRTEGTDAARLWLGWGDWNIIAAVNPDHYEQIEKLATAQDVRVTPIGSFTSEFSGVCVQRSGVRMDAPRLESERFARDSWMLAGGVEKYVDLLMHAKLP
jgi:thiamine monophosphate kinase